MNSISNDLLSLGSYISNEKSAFQNIMSDIDQEPKSHELKNVIQVKEINEDDITTDEMLTDMILQQIISDQTIAMLKRHEEAMKEIMDEE